MTAAIRAGLIGIHQCIRDSVATILNTDEDDDAERTRKFLVFQKATLALLDGHHKHEDEIVFPSFQQHKIPGFDVFLEAAAREHHQLEDAMKAIHAYLDGREKKTSSDVRHKQLWRPVSDLLEGHLSREEDLITVDVLDKFVPTEVANDVQQRIQQANKGDPMGYLTLPLILWTLNDANYDLMIRPSMPKFVRAFVCNVVMYYKGGSDLLEFVPHYRGSWEI